jgi:hypothetical protein
MDKNTKSYVDKKFMLWLDQNDKMFVATNKRIDDLILAMQEMASEIRKIKKE